MLSSASFEYILLSFTTAVQRKKIYKKPTDPTNEEKKLYFNNNLQYP